MERIRNIRRTVLMVLSGSLGGLCGCATPASPAAVDDAASMTHLGAELRPENLLFPPYFFMTDFELDQHGRIPGSPWIGAGLKTKLGLASTLQRFERVLATEGWEEPIRLDATAQSFRLQTRLQGAFIEIRAVQGTGPTRVFILYQPPQERAKKENV